MKKRNAFVALQLPFASLSRLPNNAYPHKQASMLFFIFSSLLVIQCLVWGNLFTNGCYLDPWEIPEVKVQRLQINQGKQNRTSNQSFEKHLIQKKSNFKGTTSNERQLAGKSWSSNSFISPVEEWKISEAWRGHCVTKVIILRIVFIHVDKSDKTIDVFSVFHSTKFCILIICIFFSEFRLCISTIGISWSTSSIFRSIPQSPHSFQLQTSEAMPSQKDSKNIPTNFCFRAFLPYSRCENVQSLRECPEL